MCLENFSSQKVERHNKPEIEVNINNLNRNVSFLHSSQVEAAIRRVHIYTPLLFRARSSLEPSFGVLLGACLHYISCWLETDRGV